MGKIKFKFDKNGVFKVVGDNTNAKELIYLTYGLLTRIQSITKLETLDDTFNEIKKFAEKNIDRIEERK